MRMGGLFRGGHFLCVSNRLPEYGKAKSPMADFGYRAGMVAPRRPYCGCATPRHSPHKNRLSAKGLGGGRVPFLPWIVPHPFPDGLESHPCPAMEFSDCRGEIFVFASLLWNPRGNRFERYDGAFIIHLRGLAPRPRFSSRSTAPGAASHNSPGDPFLPIFLNLSDTRTSDRYGMPPSSFSCLTTFML